MKDVSKIKIKPVAEKLLTFIKDNYDDYADLNTVIVFKEAENINDLGNVTITKQTLIPVMKEIELAGVKSKQADFGGKEITTIECLIFFKGICKDKALSLVFLKLLQDIGPEDKVIGLHFANSKMNYWPIVYSLRKELLKKKVRTILWGK